MKKHILILILLFVMPVLVHSVTEESVTIAKLSMDPVPFNDRRDPLADSPYNAFDGDLKTAALYSDFTMEFSKPVTIDQIKIMNGNAADKDRFKKQNRERDIEITLYTVEFKDDKKADNKKNKKTKKNKTVKPDEKKEKKAEEIIQEKKDNKNNEKKKDLKEPEKKEPEKKEPEKKEPEKKEPEKKEKEKKEKNIKKNDTPEKVVQFDEYNNSIEYQTEDVKLFFIASETAIEPEKKAVEDVKVKKNIPASDLKKEKKSAAADNKKIQNKQETKVKSASDKKTDKKKYDNKPAEKKKIIKKSDKTKSDNKSLSSEKKEVLKTAPLKNKTPDKKTSSKTALEKKSLKNAGVKKKESTEKNTEKASGKNIIEITGLKKEEKKTSSAVTDKKSGADKKEPDSEKASVEKEDAQVKKISAGEDKTMGIDPDKPVDKISIPQITKIEKNKIAESKNKKDKSGKKKTIKKDITKKETVVKDKSANKKTDKTKIEITESKEKTDKKKADMNDKTSEEKKLPVDKKNINPDTAKKDAGKIADKKNTENKTDKAKEDKTKKENIKKEEKATAEKVTVKKMTGVVRIQNDSTGRVLVYASLKDSMDFQSIDLKGKYAVKKIDFRTRDDEYYSGSEPDRSGITEIAFLNKGKIIPVGGIDAMKKTYAEKYSKNLSESISGETFLVYENGDVVLRMTFNKNGRIEFFDRFKCRKKGDADCTSLSMPDMWRITDGKLLMRYHTIWRTWKYELDSQHDMLSDNDPLEPPRWMKIYYKSENGFTDKFLDLFRSEKGIWAE